MSTCSNLNGHYGLQLMGLAPTLAYLRGPHSPIELRLFMQQQGATTCNGRSCRHTLALQLGGNFEIWGIERSRLLALELREQMHRTVMI